MPTPPLSGFTDPERLGIQTFRKKYRTTVERIEQINANNQYLIRGKWLLASGYRPDFVVGDAVIVAWHGDQPILILSHAMRRAKAFPTVVTAGVMEELFIAGAVGERTVYFRNAKLVALLKLADDTTIRQVVGADPDEVKWGTHDNAFFVRVGFVYSTFTLNRPGAGRSFTSAPIATLVRTEHPWDGNILMLTVSGSAAGRWVTLSYHFESDVQTDLYVEGDPEGPNTEIHVESITTSTVLDRSEALTYTEEVRIAQADVESEDIEVIDSQLDVANNLILSLTFNLSGDLISQPPASGLFQDVATKGFTQTDNPPFSSGDPTACDGPALEPTATEAWTAPSPDGDLHTIVVNITQGRVIWRSFVAAASLTSDAETLTAFASSSHQVATTEGHGFPDPPGLDTSTTTEDCATTGTTNFAGTITVPTSSEPLGAIFLDYAANTKDLHHGHAVDPTLVSLLGISTALETDVTHASVTRYSNSSFGTAGTYDVLNGPFPLSVGAYFGRVSITASETVRTCLVELKTLLYLPIRTAVTTGPLDQGEVFLEGFQELFDTDSHETANQYSLWRINITTGQVVAIQPWTSAAAFVFQTSFPFVRIFGSTFFHILGVSPTFVLWIRFHDLSTSVTNWSVYLTHAIPGVPSLGTSTVFQVSNNGSTVPADFRNFLDENLQLLWPNVVFYPPSNRLLNSWTSQRVPTLQKAGVIDPTWPPIRREVPAPVTDLKDYPTSINSLVVHDGTSVMPFNWLPQTGPSWHVLTTPRSRLL